MLTLLSNSTLLVMILKKKLSEEHIGQNSRHNMSNSLLLISHLLLFMISYIKKKNPGKKTPLDKVSARISEKVCLTERVK